MSKAKKIKISIISSVVAVVLIVGGLLTFFLTSKKSDNKLKELLANVSGQIHATYDDLAKSYNDEDSSQAVALNTSNLKAGAMLLATLDSDEDEDLWISVEGAETFQSYLNNINNVMAHYAISEYLVANSKKLDFDKTYHFQSSTVEYFAIAEYTDKYFSFTLHNDNEDICVRVNIAEKENKGKSIEFFMQSKTDDGKYCYQYSVLNFENNNYEEILLTSKNEYDGEISNEWLDDNIEKHEEYSMNHKDKNSYRGKRNERNSKGANNHNDPKTQGMKDKISQHKNKLFENFNSKKINKKNIKEFPNPQGLQDYAFNKYVAKLSLDKNGKEFLEIVRAYQWVEMDAVLKNYNFNEDVNTFTWSYKSGVEVINQYLNGNLLDINDRSCEVENFGINSTLVFKCKTKDNYYNATFSKNSQYLADYNIFLENNFEGLCSEKYSIKKDGVDIDTVYCDCNKLQLIKDNNKNLLALHENAHMNDYRIGAFDIIASNYSNLMQEITIPALKYDQEPDKNNIKIEVLNENYSKLTSKIVELMGCANFDYYLDSNYFEKSAIVGLNKPFAISKQYQNVSRYEELQTIVAKLFGFTSADSLKIAADYLANSYNENVVGVSINSVADRLKYDGAVYTTSNMFVLPFRIETSSNNGYNYDFIAYLFVDNLGQVSVLISDIEAASTVVNYRKTATTDSDLFIHIYGRCSLFETMSNILTWEYQEGFEVISQEFEYFNNQSWETHKIDKSLRSFNLNNIPEFGESTSIYLKVICRKNSELYHGSISMKKLNETTELIEKDVIFTINTKSKLETITVKACEITAIKYSYVYDKQQLEGDFGGDYLEFEQDKYLDNKTTQIDLSNCPNGTLTINYKNFDGEFTKSYKVTDNSEYQNTNALTIKQNENEHIIRLPISATIESIMYKRVGDATSDEFFVKVPMRISIVNSGVSINPTQRIIEFLESGTYLLQIKTAISIHLYKINIV